MSTETPTRPTPTPSPLPWWSSGDQLFAAGSGDVSALAYFVGERGAVNATLALLSVNALHEIAPGREISAARALPTVVETLRLIAAGAKEEPCDGNGIGVAGPRELAAIALMNLGILDGVREIAAPDAAPVPRAVSRDIYANVARLRSAIRANAARWRGHRGEFVKLTPEFMAKTLAAMAGFLGLILKAEEKETTSPE